MPEISPPALNPAQVSRLETLLKAGFQFVAFEQFARYPGVEKNGFVALLDLSHDQVKQFGSVGYRLGEGIGMLVERGGGKAFVWKQNELEATPELLAAYEGVKRELARLIHDEEPSGGASPA